MNRVHLAALAAALVLASAVLTACGGSDSNSADEDQITAAIDKAATSGDPAACTEAQTQSFNAQTAGGNGNGDPTAACQKDAANTAADSVDVTNIKVDGDTATADVAATGSILDGQTLEIALVKDGDQWKLDKIDSFTEFNRDKFIAAFGSQIEQGGGPPASVVACVKQQFQAATDEQLQAVLLDPNGGDQLFASCG